MTSQSVFPKQVLAEGLSEPAIRLEGQKVVFDKKVGLMPANIRKEETKKVGTANGKSRELPRR